MWSLERGVLRLAQGVHGSVLPPSPVKDCQLREADACLAAAGYASTHILGSQKPLNICVRSMTCTGRCCKYSCAMTLQSGALPGAAQCLCQRHRRRKARASTSRHAHGSIESRISGCFDMTGILALLRSEKEYQGWAGWVLSQNHSHPVHDASLLFFCFLL